MVTSLTATAAHHGAGYLQDDAKLTSRFTLNVGLRWEYIGPSLDTSGTVGNVGFDLRERPPSRPRAAHSSARPAAANYDPDMVNPYTGKPFGPPPEGVLLRDSNSFYHNSTPRDAFAPRAGFAWQPWGSSGRIVIGGGYGWFYQTPLFSGNSASAPLFTAAPFAQSFTNTDASNNGSTFQQPFPDHLGLRPQNVNVSTLRSHCRTRVPHSTPSAVERHRQSEARHRRFTGPRLCRLPRRPHPSGPRPQPAAARHYSQSDQLRLRR